MTKKFLPTLKARLVFWFTAICLVPLALMTTIIYLQRVKVARQLIFDKLSAVSSLRLEQINSSLDNLAIDASTLASGHSVFMAGTALLQNQNPKGTDALILLRGYLSSYEPASVASIVSRSGTVLLSTSDLMRGSSIAKPEFVASALRDQIPSYGEVYLSGIDGTPSMDVAAPIKTADQAIPAAVVVQYNLRKLLYGIMANRIGMGQSGESLLVNRDVIALTDLRGIPGAILNAKLKGRPALLAAQGQSGIAETTDYRDEKVLAAYAYIPRTGWGLVCKQDSREVFAPLRSLLFVTYGLASLISLLVCIFTFRLARSISQPILDFSRAATEIGAGDYAARIIPAGTEELRALALSFNGMAAALQVKMDAQQGLARLSESLVTADDLKDFFVRLLPVFMEVTGAKMAVAFMEDQDGEHFVPVQAIGADSSQMRRFHSKSLEGELGVILNQRSVSSFSAAHPGNGLRFVTCFGEVLPAEIVTVPITVRDQVRAFISLASEKPFPTKAHETLDQVTVLLSTSFSRVLAGEDVRRLADELSIKNAELTQQSEELVQQSTELALQSDELSRRNRELDQQKQQLEQGTRLKSEFLSNMSHELRTPLNSVLALSRVLAVHAAERLTDQERGYLDIVERNGKHLLSLINDILDLAKIESGHHDLFYETVYLERVVGEVVDGLSLIAREKGISLTLMPEGSLPPVNIDVKRLRQILQNLVGNAVKFTSEGSVSVLLRAESGQLLIDVVDTGIGIAPEHQEMIFQEFRQADGSSSRSFEGTGLGLAIVKKIALLLGGDVTVQSDLGKGSTFSLRLPLDCTAKSTVPHRHMYQAPFIEIPPRRPDGRSVLVVDDDPETVALIAEHLSQAGYQTITAGNGSDAVRLARTSRPFAITLDLMMPGMSGLDVMRELKEHPETADLPVIIVTLSEDRETGIALGAIGIISKPVDREQLIAQVAELTGAGCRLVLVADENQYDRFSIASLFKENGMDVLLAESGEQALELAMTDRPDLITLDLVLPAVDGAAVLDKLRQCPSTAAIPVVIITPRDLSKDELARLSVAGRASLSTEGVSRNVVLHELVESLGRLGSGSAGPAAKKGSRILIVEDSEAATIQLRFALESAGFSVDAVSGGRHAMDYLKAHLPDGIILDLMMPEVDGFGVLKAVRSSSLTENVPVMVMTAKTLSPGEHDRLRQLQVSHLVQKGDVDLKELLGRVYEMLGVLRVFKDDEASSLAGIGATIRTTWQGDGSLLVVEDNPDNLATLRAVLGEKYRIVEAVDGEAGLAAVRDGSPSLILLDMHLPQMDGMAVLKRLKADPATAAIPVVALTASAMAGDREKLLRAGCAEYLSKPYQIEDLLELVQRFVPEAESQP